MAIKLHRNPLSGHSHRAQLLLSLIGLDAELIDVDLKNGAHKQPEFLRMNCFGQVPVLEDGGETVADSNAILVYIAKKYGGGQWLPEDPAGAARVQRWLSVAAGQIAFGPAAARLVTVFGAKLDADALVARSHALLAVVDGELRDRRFLAGDKPTIADVAAYSYIAHAPEGNVALDEYAGVGAWLKRIEQLPGFVPMQATRVGLAA
ncbi:glutathione S-transferase [Luteimonas sp. RD2P54]|uniref:Glutathione S-transferase n=1 Tax=Luteimonas endophytica TaxID=3042023 RepID=A0ABT6JBL3_9GAMM|nr:glutathione S-transferase [Luteimonas endophytica]MDH5823568.1 glutathione S-transferase [Luteimonas endophytica]